MIMNENISAIKEFSALVLKSAENGTLKNAILASPVAGDILKIRLETRKISGSIMLQAEFSMTEGRVKQQNIAFDEIVGFLISGFENFKRAELNDSGGSASLMKSKK